MANPQGVIQAALVARDTGARLKQGGVAGLLTEGNDLLAGIGA